MSKVFHQLTTLWLKTWLYAVVVSEANNSVADEWQMNTWQLCHVRKLAFPLNISFYLTQHTPLWRSKFRILRIKKTRTKIGTLRISHTSSKLHRDIPSGSFTKTNLKKSGATTDWVEHTSVAQVEVSGGCFCLYLYRAKLLSLNLYMILLAQFCVFNHSASTIYQMYWCQH